MFTPYFCKSLKGVALFRCSAGGDMPEWGRFSRPNASFGPFFEFVRYRRFSSAPPHSIEWKDVSCCSPAPVPFSTCSWVFSASACRPPALARPRQRHRCPPSASQGHRARAERSSEFPADGEWHSSAIWLVPAIVEIPPAGRSGSLGTRFVTTAHRAQRHSTGRLAFGSGRDASGRNQVSGGQNPRRRLPGGVHPDRNRQRTRPRITLITRLEETGLENRNPIL